MLTYIIIIYNTYVCVMHLYTVLGKFLLKVIQLNYLLHVSLNIYFISSTFTSHEVLSALITISFKFRVSP